MVPPNRSKLKLPKASQLLDGYSRCTRNGFVATNNDGLITHFSPRMAELTGWVEAEMLGTPATELFMLPQAPNTESSENGVKRQESIVKTREGKNITLPVRVTEIFDDEKNIEGQVAIFSGRPNAHTIDKAQAEFVSTVSHELRTPITSIKGFASTILTNQSKIDDEKMRKYIRIIQDQAGRLSLLVEDLLAVSRLESQKLQLTVQPLDIKVLTDKTALVIEHKYNGSHEITVKAENDIAEVWGDPDRIEQILVNLVDNAVKYSPEANKVDVTISTITKDDKKQVQIDVKDYGIGISEEDQVKVFKKFSRLDTPLTRTTEGSGLGLYICHSLAKLQNGNLSVSSVEGSTTMTLYLSTESYDAGELWWD